MQPFASHISLPWGVLQGLPQQVLGSSCQASRSWRGMEGSRCFRSSGLSAPCQPQIDGGAFGASSRLDGWPVWRGSAQREMSHPSSLGIGMTSLLNCS